MRRAISSALASAVILTGGIVAGVATGSVASAVLLGPSMEGIGIAVTLAAALAGVGVGGAAWGWTISRITGAGDRVRMAWAGAIGFGPSVVLVAVALTFSENVFVEQRQGPDLPIHNVFTILFVPAAATVAGAGAFALGLAARRRARAGGLALLSAVGGGAAFLVVNLTLDAFGFRVGAPGAAERATMVTTALLGGLSTALVSGGLIATMLSKEETRLRAPAVS